jgi:RNA polymerase sigma factor (TIGR02999 family)
MVDEQPSMPEVDASVLLSQLRDGQSEAAAKLMPIVYAELRRLASKLMNEERPEHTLQATELVHEAFLKLVRGPDRDYEGRAHLYRVAARAMRQILVDHARRRMAEVRGGEWVRRPFEDALSMAAQNSPQFLELHNALEELKTLDPLAAELVEMLFFAGMKREQVARVRGLSERSLYNDWKFARAWLERRLGG